jgi:predicted secreted protein
MMKKSSLIISLVLIIFSAGTAYSSDRTINDSDDWATVYLGIGDRLTISLKDDPKDSYQWSVGRYDDDILVLENGPVSIPDRGVAVTRFVAKGDGTTTLLMRYNNLFDAGDQDVDAFQITVTVGVGQ